MPYLAATQIRVQVNLNDPCSVGTKAALGDIAPLHIYFFAPFHFCINKVHGMCENIIMSLYSPPPLQGLSPLLKSFSGPKSGPIPLGVHILHLCVSTVKVGIRKDDFVKYGGPRP